ncbi:hypothetical protein LSH36_12g16120 [Paralvinella palmiformis]|uniref:Fringe-like glycosyltransferase domain-containing protein n=1 Tax=Paralvinella palmiformis TaxID=53620 RepID=A0AAD9NG77_9ANNE|nr:hypothetical protein LSH36_12g16120 [Paralvinella palmiformis]
MEVLDNLFKVCLYLLGVNNTDRQDDLAIIILSQPNMYHAKQAALLRNDLLQQSLQGSSEPINVFLLHERWPHPGGWTILPILHGLLKHFKNKLAILFCEEETRINLRKMYTVLSKFDLSKELFIGKGLRDREATIIHHFAFHENPSAFVYPDFSAGIVARLAENPPASDFAIDPKHELALYIWNNGEGIRMKDADFLCTKPEGEECATTFPKLFPSCGNAVAEGDVFFAVKTCSKYHETRVSVVKNTWAKDTNHIEYYSEVEDQSIPTINLGVPNTEKGHCNKTMAIIKRFREHNRFLQKKYKWLVITDDDTLLSVPNLRKLLTCYDHDEPVVLGERYGYGVFHEHSGYNYITGGGGMVFSYEAVKMIIDLELCWCAGADSPDDMILGLCFKHLGIIAVHSPYFHQARPVDYCKSYLEHQLPVSFHKHWMINPYQVYNEWLSPSLSKINKSHEEL